MLEVDSFVNIESSVWYFVPCSLSPVGFTLRILKISVSLHIYKQNNITEPYSL